MAKSTPVELTKNDLFEIERALLARKRFYQEDSTEIPSVRALGIVAVEEILEKILNARVFL